MTQIRLSNVAKMYIGFIIIAVMACLVGIVGTLMLSKSILLMTLLIILGMILTIGLGMIIANYFNRSVHHVFGEIEKLLTAFADGDLKARGDASKFLGSDAIIIKRINDTFDKLFAPIQEAQTVLEKMAVNDFSLEVTGQYQGMLKEFSEQVNLVRKRLLSVQDIAVRVSKGDTSRLEEFKKIGKRSENDHLVPSFTLMMQTIQDLIDESDSITKAVIAGNLKATGKIDKFEGGYRAILEGFNHALESIAGPLNSSIQILSNYSVNDYTLKMPDNYQGDFKIFADAINDVQKRFQSIQNICNNISNGDFSDLENLRKIGRRSDNDMLVPSLINMVEAIKSLLTELDDLTQNAIKGQLDSRADVTKFHGNYQTIIKQVNQLIDVLLTPLTEAQLVLGKMAINDYTLEMSGQYQGMFKEFAEKINMVRTRLLSVLDIAIRVSKGDNSRLDEFKKIGKRSENDQMMPAFTMMMLTLQSIIDEVLMLANAAIKGNLDIRGNTNKFEGGYKEIIEGLNQTMAAVEQPLQEAASVLQEMAAGNLCVEMQGEYQGSYAIIKESLNQTMSSFNEILGEINEAAFQVASGSKQISDGSQALSQGATEQASTIEELTSSLTEISVQTKQNAQDADHANGLALKAKDNAEQGNLQMKEMLNSMEDINASSANISKIIKVIDEIAFQTNILALNAAVEAARAGQYGKGFAVVAEEVRNLAARSADAAKETTGMIEGSIKKVENGSKIANETAQALRKIYEGVTEAADLVGNIAAASNQQATGIAQINQGITQVSEVMQTNTATSEQSAAASEELSSQAEALKNMVNRFKLDNQLKNDNFHAYAVNNPTGNTQDTKKRGTNPKKQGLDFPRVKIALKDIEFGKY